MRKGIFTFLIVFVLLFGFMVVVSAVEEKVVCVFENSDEMQRCYVPEPDTWEGLECEGIGSCIVSIEGPRDFDIHWISTCTPGGGAEVIIDGRDDLIIFDCETGYAYENSGPNFRFLSGICDDGTTYDAGGDDICKTKPEWYRELNNFCQDYDCIDEEVSINIETGEETLVPDFVRGGKIGNFTECIKSYETFDECSFYDINDFLEDLVVEEEPNYFCLGCSLDYKCYPLGYRKSGEYCSDSLEFIRQLPEDLTCENNFECKSNLCLS